MNPGNLLADQIDYTITDNQGGVTTGYVDVVVVLDPTTTALGALATSQTYGAVTPFERTRFLPDRDRERDLL